MTRRNNEQIVLTGCGWVTPFAAGNICEVLERAVSVQSAAAREGAFWAVPDELRKDYPDLPKELTRDHEGWITAVALEAARQDASLGEDSLDPDRVGMMLGCAFAGQLGMMSFATEVREQTPRFVSPIHFPQTVGNYVAGALARGYHIRGPHATIASGVASSLDAIVEAAAIVANDQADVVYAGGASTLSDGLAGGLGEPGVHMSEGACLFVVESASHAAKRGANILARVVGTSHHGALEQLAEESDAAIVAGTSGYKGGTIVIEHWTGRCTGALGAACAAAAIGAAKGLPVPIQNHVDSADVSIASLGLEGVSTLDGAPLAMVFADGDQGRLTLVKLAITTRG